ncbi:MYCBP-associated protein [Pseudoliparis swirei]|uniref:MYCBP-associated protein n=1 Tax=Pseudoliparis swirei TaxID=2059687 RepID=UPI0024BDB52C|nr:MYCBP-associated protein [Pseudoliparis swirei]
MEFRRPAEDKKLKTSEEDMQIHIPKPPKGRQKPALTACVRKTQPADEVRDAVNLDPRSQLPDDTGLEGLRFDDHGMVLPHSILGSLEDFRSYLEAKGETEWVKLIPKSKRYDPSEALGTRHSEAAESGRGLPSGHRNVQCNALQHWHTHMTQRRQQQDFLSELLDRPVENLLMNQANHFRETQEKREFLNQVMPLIHSGYGYRVGSEFWSLPHHYGDELSGITATLTQTEQGRREPVTHVGQPSSVRQESGIMSAETLRPASRTWAQSAYLQRRCQELGEVLRDMDMKTPEINGLEVIGSSEPFTRVSVCRDLPPEKEEEEKEHEKMKKESLDPLADDDERPGALLIPALRFCGQLASWTGNSTARQGEVGLSATLIFEAPTGERASSHLELHNEGSTAIFYSWEQLPVTRSFPIQRPRTKNQHFYFNSSSGVIRPGDAQRVEFIFKSEESGIQSEVWQLNTHPVLLRGASMQLALRGVALYQDNTADQRLFIETKLEEIVKVKLCRAIVDEVLRGVRSPERPSSPAELYVTEEQVFLGKNPELQYLPQPVEDLKTLWQEVHPESSWDFSVHTLRQVVLSVREEEEPAQEKSLARLNSLLLQLYEPPQLHHRPLTAAAIGQQLWRELLDTMAAEATRLRNLLGLPEKDTWVDTPPSSDPDLVDKSEHKGGAAATEGSGTRSRIKDDNKGESQSAEAKGEKDGKKKGRRREEVGKRTREKQDKETASLTDIPADGAGQQPPNVELEAVYTGVLHKKVYVLMEHLVGNLCDLMAELDEGT